MKGKWLDALNDWKSKHPDRICDQVDPEYQPLLDHALDLDKLIDRVIEEESAGDLAKRQRYETAFEYLTNRETLSARLGPTGVKEVAWTFVGEPAGIRELCLSGASFYVEAAVFYFAIVITPAVAALSLSNASQLFGTFSGIRYESRRRARAGGAKKHRAGNELKIELLQTYLSNPDRFGASKEEAANNLADYQDEIGIPQEKQFDRTTIRRWLIDPQTSLMAALNNINN